MEYKYGKYNFEVGQAIAEVRGNPRFWQTTARYRVGGRVVEVKALTVVVHWAEENKKETYSRKTLQCKAVPNALLCDHHEAMERINEQNVVA